MSYEERVIATEAAKLGHVGIDAAGVAGQMRLRYGTLDALSIQDFRNEIMIAVECEREEPGYLDDLAKSYGYRDDPKPAEPTRPEYDPASGLYLIG